MVSTNVNHVQILKVVFLLTTCLNFIECQRKQSMSKKTDKISASQFMMRFYRQADNLTEAPSFETGEPTQVQIGMYINNMKVLQEKEMTVSYNSYMRMKWNDPRLAFDRNEYNGQTEFKVPKGSWKNKIWLPDLFMRNVQELSGFETVTDHVLLKINSDGGVWCVFHFSHTNYCPMQLAKFPFDTQSCPIMFESFGSTMDVFYFSWLDSAISIDSSIQLPNFVLEDTILYDCSQNYSTGAFPCLEVRLVLKRDTGFYVLQVFLPSVMFVIISWFSFWIDIQHFSHRLLLLLLLTMLQMSLYGMVSNEIPSVSYIKAIDIWMYVSFLFIFVAMLEATLVKAVSPAGFRGTDGEEEKSGDYAMLLGKVYSPSSVRRVIELCARIGLPILYLLFIIIYFSIYS